MGEADIAEKSPCGRYFRFKKILGRGAFKDVYKGFDWIDNVEIAWNQISVDDDKPPNSLENRETMAYSEAVLLRSLDHENIMKCYSCWVDCDIRSVNMITELFNYGSLRQYTKNLGAVDVPTIKKWGKQILQGLHYLHTRNPRIVHRDLKCDNIFVDVHSGSVTIKIGDFGLAMVMEQSPIRVLAGTPEFMAPEYYDEEYNELVDVYAFGMCLLELETCECPYSECTYPAQIFKKVTSGIKPAALGKVLDLQVKAMIEKCLLPASLRPSAGELLKDPFFSSGTRMVEEENISMRSCSMISSGGESSLTVAETLCGGGHDDLGLSSCYSDDLILTGISALYNSMSLTDDHKPLSFCHQSFVDDEPMKSRITSASSSGAVSNFWYAPHHSST